MPFSLFFVIFSSMGEFPQSAGEFPQTAGEFPQRPGEFPQAAGEFPQAAGEFPQAAGEFPQRPGELPGSGAGEVAAVNEGAFVRGRGGRRKAEAAGGMLFIVSILPETPPRFVPGFPCSRCLYCRHLYVHCSSPVTGRASKAPAAYNGVRRRRCCQRSSFLRLHVVNTPIGVASPPVAMYSSYSGS